uniref:DDE Tnp4 domain-containing protein n=1 Tax=Amphimedon queenslandica TaxID=400682 RepID=A0A1X7VI48_AMPQE
LTFSSYKNHNTARALAGITPSGAFSFVSPLYGGSISDRELFVQSGLLEKLEQGDAVMADKGLNIADLLETKGVSLNIPPRKNSGQFDSIELIETRRIALLRVHIERAFGRVKSFKILSSIPNNMAGYASDLFITCAILTNFQPPLIIDIK